MNSNLINNLEILIEGLNTKQKQIANRAKVNSNFRFFETNVLGKNDVFFEDLPTKQIFHFITYIKSNCNCD